MGLDELCGSFLDLWYHFDPAEATRAGVSGADGRLGSFDAEAIRQHVAALRSIAGAIEDLDIEDTDEEIDRTAFLDHLRVLLFRFEHEHPWQRDPALWVSHAADALDALLDRHPPDAATASSALSRLAALDPFLASARDSLQRPPLLLVEAALLQLGGLRSLVEASAHRFASVWDLEGVESAAMVQSAGDAVVRFQEVLRSEVAPDTEPHAAAIGVDEVDRRLHHEHASVHSGAEVYRGALRLATEVEAEVTAFAAAIDPGRDWRDVWETVVEESAPANLADFATALREARAFAEEHGWGGPTGVPLEVREASSHQQVFEPAASYREAGGSGPAAVCLHRVLLPRAPWQAARLGVPGVHYHTACRAALGAVRRAIAAPSTRAGWGLYAVEVLRAAGYAPDPVERLAERVAFLELVHLAVVDLGIHTKQFSPADAIGHLTTHVPMDHEAAATAVRRIAHVPLDACAAILGRTELLRLRDDVRMERGSTFDHVEFHATVLRYGGFPVPLIRWGMGLDG